MTIQLTEDEKKLIDNNAFAFWADLKVMVSGRAVILYVDSHRDDFDYPVILRYDDHPEDVMQAVLEYDGYKNRSKASARYIRRTFEGHGIFSGTKDVQTAAAEYVEQHPLSWIEESKQVVE